LEKKPEAGKDFSAFAPKNTKKPAFIVLCGVRDVEFSGKFCDISHWNACQKVT